MNDQTGECPPNTSGSSRARAGTALDELAMAYLQNRPHHVSRGVDVSEAFKAGWTQRGLSRAMDEFVDASRVVHSPSEPANETTMHEAKWDRPTCGSCDHWEPHPDDPGQPGQCRLNAPVVTGGLHGPERTLWPTVDVMDWCGQHSQLAVVITGEVAEFEMDRASDQDVSDYLHGRWNGAYTRKAVEVGEAISAETIAAWNLQPGAVVEAAPHWHHVLDVAQRLGAHRSAKRPGRWNVPAFGRLEITAQELLDLGRAAADQGRGK